MTALLEIDADWFREALSERGASQRSLARHLKVDASAITLLFQGKRRMQMDEAERIARFLGAPLEEVLRRAGLPVTPANARSHHVRLAGIIGSDAQVKPSETSTTIEAPSSLPIGAVAARWVGDQWCRGAVFFYQPSDRVEAEAVERLAWVRLDDGREFLGNLRRGIERGSYDIATEAGRIEDADVEAAAPVLWAKF